LSQVSVFLSLQNAKVTDRDRESKSCAGEMLWWKCFFSCFFLYFSN
jgi:hypothetical protein